MALGETMSGSNDWFQIYQQNFPAPQVVPSVPDAITVTSASGSTTQSSVGIPNSFPPGNTSANINNSLSPEGKISKPVRRRSRASRRTPTTLLNTDTTNFRAMVQRYTGGPSAPFAASGIPNFGFGLGPARQGQVNQSTPLMITPNFHLQQQQQQLYQQQNHHNQQNRNMFSVNNNSTDHVGMVDFYQRISNTNPTTGTTSRPSNNESIMINPGFVMEHHGGGRFFPSTSTS